MKRRRSTRRPAGQATRTLTKTCEIEAEQIQSNSNGIVGSSATINCDAQAMSEIPKVTTRIARTSAAARWATYRLLPNVWILPRFHMAIPKEHLSTFTRLYGHTHINEETKPRMRARKSILCYTCCFPRKLPPVNIYAAHT